MEMCFRFELQTKISGNGHLVEATITRSIGHMLEVHQFYTDPLMWF